MLNSSRCIVLRGKTSWSPPMSCGKPFWSKRGGKLPMDPGVGNIAVYLFGQENTAEKMEPPLNWVTHINMPRAGYVFLKQIRVLRCLTSPKEVELSKKYLYTRKLCQEPISAPKFQFYIQWEVRCSWHRPCPGTICNVLILGSDRWRNSGRRKAFWMEYFLLQCILLCYHGIQWGRGSSGSQNNQETGA